MNGIEEYTHRNKRKRDIKKATFIETPCVPEFRVELDTLVVSYSDYVAMGRSVHVYLRHAGRRDLCLTVFLMETS